MEKKIFKSINRRFFYKANNMLIVKKALEFNLKTCNQKSEKHIVVGNKKCKSKQDSKITA